MANHVVFGAGLIGCYLGGALQANGADVSLVCRQYVRDKLTDGLLLTDFHEQSQQVESLKFIDTDDEQNRVCQHLWLTVKCTAVEQAVTQLKRFVGENTVIFCCQNGLGSEKIVQDVFPDNTVLRVMVPFNVAELKPGHLHRGSEGSLAIELPQQNFNQIQQLIEEVQSSMLPVVGCQDMYALLWAKLQLNLGNSINALANIPVKAMLQQRAYRRVIAGLMDELLAVAKGLNIDLPKVAKLPGRYLPFILRLPNFLFLRVADQMLAIDPEVRTSMWWDLSQGKRTEIDHLNGAIVEAGSKLGIACPINEKIISLIKAAEKNTGEGVAFTGQELLHEVNLN